MTAIKRFFLRHKEFFVVFFGILAYEYIVVLHGAVNVGRSIGMSFYALDYGMGFVSRILPGAVFRFLTGNADISAANVYHPVLIVLFIILISVLLERFLQKLDGEERKIGIFLAALFLTGPATFAVFMPDNGVLEFHMALAAAVFFVCLAYKTLWVMIIPLCAVVLLINPAAIICWAPFFCILILYRFSLEEKSKNPVLFTFFILSVAVSLGLFFWLMLNEQSHLKYSFDEFHQLLSDRGVNSFIYPEYYLYKRLDCADEQLLDAVNAIFAQSMDAFRVHDLTSLLQSLQNTVKTVLRLSTWDSWKKFVKALLILSPVLYMIFRFFAHLLIGEKQNKTKRFCYLCMGLLFFLTLIPGVFMTWDPDRWLAYAFIPLASAFLYVLYCEREKGFGFLARFFSKVSTEQLSVFVICYAVFYFI